jgi:simple sugar transport system permease protein
VSALARAANGTTGRFGMPLGGRAGRVASMVGLYALFIGIGLLLSGLLVALTDTAPLDVAQALFDGSFGSPSGRGILLEKTAPILIVALGAIVASRAGILNIGQEGQVLIGGTLAVSIALHVDGPIWLVMTLTLLAALVGGALWAGIAAAMHFTRGVDVIITTLLLNFVAVEVVSFAVNRDYLLRETRVGNNLTVPQTDRIPDTLHLPEVSVGDVAFHSGIFLALLLLVVVAVAIPHTRWGFRLRMLGSNPSAARSAGVKPARMGGGALMLSGGLAGLAGGVMLTGDAFRIQTGFASNVGYEGLLVALMARQNPIGALFAALFFGVLRAGGGFLAATGVPSYFVDVVVAMVVLAALLPPVVHPLLARRRGRGAGTAAEADAATSLPEADQPEPAPAAVGARP